MGLNNHLIAGGALRPGLSVLESMMLVHRSRIDHLDVPARGFSARLLFSNVKHWVERTAYIHATEYDNRFA